MSFSYSQQRAQVVEQYYADAMEVVEREQNGDITGDQAKQLIKELNDTKKARLAALTRAASASASVAGGDALAIDEDDEGEDLGSDDTYSTEDMSDDSDESFIDDDDDESEEEEETDTESDYESADNDDN